MRRLALPLLAAAVFLLAPLGAGATNAGEPNYGYSGMAGPAKDGIVAVNYEFYGTGVQTIKFFLVGFNPASNTKATSKYLAFSKKGSSRYYVLHQAIVVKQAGGNAVIPKGTRYWVVRNPPFNATTKVSINIAVRVSPNIPLHQKLCMRTSAIATSPAHGGQPAFFSYVTTGQGYCMSGRMWINPMGG